MALTTHKKYKYNNAPGIPDVLYHLPEMSGHRDQKKTISLVQLNSTMYACPTLIHDGEILMDGRNDQLFEYFNYVVQNKNLPYPPTSWLDAKKVFVEIANLV